MKKVKYIVVINLTKTYFKGGNNMTWWELPVIFGSTR